MPEEKKEQTVQERVVADYIVNIESQLKNLNGLTVELAKDASDKTIERLGIKRPVEKPKGE